MPTPTDATIGPGPSDAGGAPRRVPGYEVLEEIGRGGMGVVYRARQAALDRVVALKVAIAGEHASAEAIERFLREARASARLDHPNIVPVYDSGREGGLFWFTMRFVEGTTLSREVRGAGMAPRRAAGLARSIALALDYAHAAGIVHRDVKPGNVLLDERGDPLLSDFGLAKDVTAERLTAPGAALGTPSYAAPEQMSGDPADARTDVYGLGATLYEMLTGRPPFTGDSPMAVAIAVLSEDPIPPRAILASLPADLETVCLRAIEKDPARRYPTARALADDLGRFLDGEAIHARPPSTVARLARAAGRHRGALAAAFLSAAAVCTAVVWGLQREGTAPSVSDASAEAAAAAADARRLAEGRAARAEEVGRKAERVSAVLARWRRLREPVLRLDALRYDRRTGPAERKAGREGALEEIDRFVSMAPDDPASRAATAGLSGWALWLSGREEEGLSRMRGASAIDPDVPLGRLMEALVLFTRYVEQVRLPMMEESGGRLRFHAAMGEDEEMRRDRESIEALLAEASKAAVWGKEGSEDFAGAVGAARAFHEGDLQAAEAALTRALDAPDLEWFRTELLLARALVRYFLHRFSEARADLLEIRAARPGQPEIDYYLGESSIGMAMQASLEGRDPRPLYAEAVASMDEAIALDPDRGTMVVGRGCARYRWGEAEALRGGDAIGQHEKAVADFDKALSIDASDRMARLNRGNARLRWGVALREAGGDPRRLYALALEDYDAMLAADARDGFALSNRGLVWQRLGECEAAAGGSPIPSYEKSILDYEAATALDDTDAAMRNNLGNAWLRKGVWELSRGVDAEASIRRAVEAYGEAIKRMPEMAEAWGNRGTAWTYLGKRAAGRNEDPTEAWELAEADLGKALEMNADRGMYGSHRADMMLARAAWRISRGEDASEEYRSAIEDCSGALEASPSSPEGLVKRMKANLAYGQWQASRGQDPTEAYDQAIADGGAAVEIRPGLAQVHSYCGMTWRARAAWEEKGGQDPRGSCRKAIEAYGRAAALDAGDPSIPYNRGNAWMAIGTWEAGHGEDANGALGSALDDYRASLARDARFWRALVNTGDALERLGRVEEAIASYESALAIVGDGYPALHEMLERARSKLGR